MSGVKCGANKKKGSHRESQPSNFMKSKNNRKFRHNQLLNEFLIIKNLVANRIENF